MVGVVERVAGAFILSVLLKECGESAEIMGWDKSIGQLQASILLRAEVLLTMS
jgi:hypothetical protein